MNALIGFTVMDHDIEFPENVRRIIMANPDVEHFDNYAEFTINGQKRKCALFPCYRKSWAEASTEDGKAASFFHHVVRVLAPLDDLNEGFGIGDASNFWQKMCKNTKYVNAPEECLAGNFSYAVMLRVGELCWGARALLACRSSLDGLLPTGRKNQRDARMGLGGGGENGSQPFRAPL